MATSPIWQTEAKRLSNLSLSKTVVTNVLDSKATGSSISTMKVLHSSQDVLSEFKGGELKWKKRDVEGTRIRDCDLSLKIMVTISNLYTSLQLCFIFLVLETITMTLKCKLYHTMRPCLKIFKDQDEDQNASLTVYKVLKYPTPASPCNYTLAVCSNSIQSAFLFL